MQPNRYAINAYHSAQLTTPPLTAVVMLYDGIMVRIAAAGEAARKGDYDRQFKMVMSAARIIDGLNRCLDMEQGGSVAISLREMYESVARALFRSVGRESGGEVADRLVSAVRMTRDAWAEVAGLPPSSTSTTVSELPPALREDAP
jgi:flagellar protein FliS